MAVTMDDTQENRTLALTYLRKWCDGRRWRGLLEKAASAKGAPEAFMSETTVYRMRKEGYQAEHMQEKTFHQIVWLLNLYKAWEVQEEDYNLSLQASAKNFGPALQQFINPKPDSIQTIAEQMIGNYQGYRLSISESGYVIRFHLSVTYDEKNNVLVTKEIVSNPMAKSKEIFEGAIAVNLEHTGLCYIVARVRKNLAITGLQFTVLYSFHADGSNGKTLRMDGVVSGQSIHGPFARNVVFVREDLIKKDFVPSNEVNTMIVKALNRPIDIHVSDIPK